ncbi:MAG: type VII secretion-associated protein [Corynebacterium sp.]|uniref:type VII secretion-associated protein n=1 Tax=Corynebacterium sp. TaxID=1720 RepID=UPI0026DD2F9F|nr:type VII secretion-associated protein [Corynebacterium sp.]MDO4760826.1 type VII secretion-associated protein [Corynebacterium sp.]
MNNAHAFMRAAADNSDLTITVLDTATIFEGHDTVYRYDLPKTAIDEGWGLDALVEQAHQLMHIQWPNCDIAIDTDPDYTLLVIDALRAKGVHAFAVEQPCEEPIVDDHLAENEENLINLRERKHDDKSSAGLGYNKERFFTIAGNKYTLAISMVVILTLVFGFLSIRGTVGQRTTTAQPRPSASSTQPATTATIEPAVTPTSIREKPPPPPARVEKTETLTHANTTYTFTLPEHFQLKERTQHDGMFTATGADENLRILFAADPAYDAQPAAIFEQLQASIDSDPALDSAPVPQLGRGPEFAYTERPGDGSEVGWSVWVENGFIYSVGCHSRQQITLAQRATCRELALKVHAKTAGQEG